MRAAAAAALASMAMLGLASQAEAAPRYASPGGSGKACAQIDPCSLETAIEEAKENDEVIVGAGTYMPASQLLTPEGVGGIDIHGAAGGAMPKIIASTSIKWALEFRGQGGRLADLALEETAPTFAWGVKCIKGGVVERVMVTVAGDPSIGLNLIDDCTVRDSLVLASGTKSQGILATGGTTALSGVARNVTAVATGPESSGITSSFSFLLEPGGYTLDAKNVIASGEGSDLHTAGGSKGVGHFAISNSNFETASLMEGSTVTGGSNQTSAPLFVDAATGDYREAPGSPTIDAGVAGQLGPTDLAGAQRVQGAAPDIGAYEFPSPPVPAGKSAVAGGVRTIAIRPKRFRARKSGGPVGTAVGRSRPPIGTKVTYTMSGPAEVEFSVSRRLTGRKVGKGCQPKTHANAGHATCTIFKPLPGRFAQQGATGADSFVFTGRIGGRALPPGHYSLTALAGHLVSAQFTIAG